MTWGAVAVGGAALVGGVLSSNAAGDAADAQSQASAAQIAEQRREYDQSRSDQLPFMQNGQAANNKLAYLLGLNPGSGGYPTDQQIRDQVLPKFQTLAPNGMVQQTDEAGLNAEIGRQIDARQAAMLADQNGGSAGGFGSLTNKFSQNDLNNDVVYQNGLQFGLNQGTSALNQRALQSGNYDSGATMKALTQYANDYGSTKANDAYNRFNTDNTNIYNRLAGISGTGQTATNSVQSAGTNMANNVSQSIGDSGNARSAGIIGGANAWGNAFGGANNAYNNYNSNQLLQGLLNNNTSGGINYGSGYSGGTGGLDYGYGGA